MLCYRLCGMDPFSDYSTLLILNPGDHDPDHDLHDDLKMYSKPIHLSNLTELGRNALVLGRYDP